jgi:hypothetical protein
MGSAAADEAQHIEKASDSCRTATRHRCRFGPEKKFINFKTVIFYPRWGKGSGIRGVKGSSGRVFVIILILCGF